MASMTIEIIVPDQIAIKVRDTLCTEMGYDPSLGISKVEWIRRHVLTYLKNMYIDGNMKAKKITAVTTMKESIAQERATIESEAGTLT